jgi:predicted ATPase
LVLVTFRQELGVPWLEHAHVTPLAVNRLSRRNIRALVHSVTAGKEFPEPLLGQIVTRTDGIPLFVEELTNAVIESGILEERGDRFVLTNETPSHTIPSTLKDSLEARLDQLGPAKETAQIGAALGREFPGDLLAAVSPLEETEIEEALDRLVRSNLVYRRSSSWPPRYVFRHALIQEAAYESLLKSRRQRLHARIAQAIEERFPTLAEAEPHLLAHHHILAEQIKPALENLSKAGRRALQRSAFAETIGYMSRASELLPQIDDTQIRERHELEIYIMLGAAHRIVSGFASPVVEDCFKRARSLCDRVGTAIERVSVLRGLWMCHFTRGELAAARELAEQTIAVARDNDESSSLMLGRWMLGIILFWQGEFSLARKELESALALYEPTAQRNQLLSAQLDPGIATMAYLAWSLSLLGFPDQALERSSASLARARALGEPFTLAFALLFACCVRLTLNRNDDLRGMLDEVRGITETHGFSHWKTVAQVLAGQVEIAAGRHRAGIALVEEGCMQLRAEGSTVNLPWSIAIAATAYSEVNQPQQALTRVLEAIALAEQTSEHHWLAELYRIKGELLLASSADNAEEAETCVRQAVNLARGQEAKLIELRAATTLAHMTAGTSRAAKARGELASILGWFSEGFETADFRSAADALKAMA